MPGPCGDGGFGLLPLPLPLGPEQPTPQAPPRAEPTAFGVSLLVGGEEQGDTLSKARGEMPCVHIHTTQEREERNRREVREEHIP